MHRRGLHWALARAFHEPAGRQGEHRSAQHEGATSSTVTTIVLRGRCVVPGRSEGEALVTHDRISGWGGIDSRTGTIVETRHELRGVSFAGKVLSSGRQGLIGWSTPPPDACLAAPRALLFNEMTTKIALGAVVMRIPTVTDLDRDPLTLIETGDWVRVDGDRGIVEIRKKSAAA
jgi:predicted aconitase with swiveling domain